MVRLHFGAPAAAVCSNIFFFQKSSPCGRSLFDIHCYCSILQAILLRILTFKILLHFGPRIASNPACREIFCLAFMKMVATLDMQLPTPLLQRDFNGAVTPARDYSKDDGTVCLLLARLLGPGGPLLDLQMVVSPELFAPTFHSFHVDLTNWSRCDWALGNRPALGLVARVSVAYGWLPLPGVVGTPPSVLDAAMALPSASCTLVAAASIQKVAQDGKVEGPLLSCSSWAPSRQMRHHTLSAAGSRSSSLVEGAGG